MNWFCKALIIIILAILAQSSSAADKPGKKIISEENLLVVEIAVGQNSTEENVEIYQHEGGFLVPLGFLTQFVDFPIEVNMDNGQAYGWFIKENKNFLLDMNKRTVIVEGKEKKLGGRVAELGADDIYVDSSLFSEWFPIDLELDFSHLLLKIKPREKLPFQDKEDRNNQHNLISKNEKKANNYPKINTEPANFTAPFMDVDMGNQFDTKANPNNNSSFSVLAQGDAAKQSTNLFLSGDTKNGMISARIKAGNKDKDANLLGGLHATEYSVGDIDSIALPMVSTNGHGYGALISNFDFSRPDQFDQTSFIGDSQPGWEVELYRNGELLQFQLVGEDGRYAFNNIPVLYGNNNFRIISYGPQGQKREETKNYNIDDSISQKGKFNYRISADEKSQSIFGVDEQLTNIQTPKEGRFVSDFEYGLTNKVTLATGLVSTPLEDQKTHNYETLGLKSSILGTLSSLNTAYDDENGGTAADAVINTSIKDVSVRVEQKEFNNFVSEEELTTSPLRKSTSKADINGRFSSIFPAGMSYGLGAQEEKFANSSNITTYTNRLATSLFDIGFGNNLQWVETNTNGTALDTGDGTFSIRGTYKQIFLRLSTDYTFSPDSALRAVSLSMQKDLPNNMNVRSDIKKDISGADLTTVNFSVNKEFKYYRLSTIASADTADAYTIGVRLSFSLGKNTNNNEWFAKNRTIANDGAISASAFLDKNYNGIYDGDDTVLENVGFESGNRKYPSDDNKKSTLINNVTPYVPSDIKLDVTTLEDPFLVPEVSGYNVTTRPGVISKVLFPVSYTTEIDGTIYNKKGEKTRPVSRAVVELKNSDGKVVNTTKSEYDGFYVLSGVIPGDYTISIAEETLDKLKSTTTPIDINIPNNSDAISGIDITATDGDDEK